MNRYHFTLFLILAMVFNSCTNSSDPANEENITLTGKPITIDVNINTVLLQVEHSPTYLVDYSELQLNGASLSGLKHYYPALGWDVDKEFVMAENDSFIVEMKNCKKENEWLIDLGSVEIGEENKWINSEVVLSGTEKLFNTDSTIDYRFTFKILKPGKGYICLIEKNELDQISYNQSHGLLIGYTTNPLERILLNVDEIKWMYNTQEETFSTVSVMLKGTTNIYRLRGMTTGDGILSAMEIPILDDGSFEIEIPVAFSHMEGVVLKTNSELILYGTVGLPKVIPLINPKSDDL